MSIGRWPKHHRARAPAAQPLPSRRSDGATKASVVVSVVAALASVASAWFAYHQVQLQNDQAYIARDQLRLQALQAVPLLIVQRGRTDSKTGRPTIAVCGPRDAFLSVSGMRVRWLPEFGRYARPATSQNTSSIDVAVVLSDEVKWVSSVRKGGEHCATVIEPSWLPFQTFIHSNLNAPRGYSYWYRSLAFVTVFQRDHAGAEHVRHYVFTHESSAVGDLVSEGEAAHFDRRYEEALAQGRRLTVDSPTSDLSGVHQMFRQPIVGSR